jgi:restriction system protein
MRAARRQLELELARDLLSRIVHSKPAFFERLVIKLLTAMGYGGSTANAARALGRSGDGGVDGVIDQDPLGLDRVYVQAKRYGETAIGPSAIRDFFGALDQFKAAKGLFMTTSTFSDTARRTAKDMSKRMVLIDGDELARLMIQYDVGCRIEETLFIKKVDEEFFEE